MSLILVKTPESPYVSSLDTGVMEVTILNAFLGTTFISESGEILRVVMRDTGFELSYSRDLTATPIRAEAKLGKLKKEK